MPGQRFPMRKIRDVLRLNAGGLSKRKIAVSLGIGATAAGDCIRRARQAGLSWPLPDDLGDEALEARCKRRRENPSLKRPESLVAPEQKCLGR